LPASHFFPQPPARPADNRLQPRKARRVGSRGTWHRGADENEIENEIEDEIAKEVEDKDEN
jgi:hypothetical protein